MSLKKIEVPLGSVLTGEQVQMRCGCSGTVNKDVNATGSTTIMFNWLCHEHALRCVYADYVGVLVDAPAAIRSIQLD